MFIYLPAQKGIRTKVNIVTKQVYRKVCSAGMIGIWRRFRDDGTILKEALTLHANGSKLYEK